VQWPYRIEHGLTQGLMRAVTGVTVEVLGWFNIPAFQHGNLIEVSTGVVSVDDACSGIRSFQSSLTAALLMGEFYRLRALPRVGLVACGVGLAFLFNVVRTVLLSWQASQHGLASLARWHDPAGFSVAVACFLCLWFAAVLFKSRWSVVNDPVVPSLQPSALSLQPSLPRRYLLAVGCWAVLCIGATEVWYRSHEVKDAGVFHWSVNLPKNNPAFQEVELPPRTVALPGHDLGAAGRWEEGDGSQWTADFLRWQPRPIHSVILSRIHRPDRRLPAEGMQQVADAGIKCFAAGHLKLPFRRYTYEAGGKAIHVFFCQWEDGSEQQMGLSGSNPSDRLRSVLVGRRKVGNQSLELMVSGYATLEEADRALAERLPQLVRMEGREGTF